MFHHQNIPDRPTCTWNSIVYTHTKTYQLKHQKKVGIAKSSNKIYKKHFYQLAAKLLFLAIRQALLSMKIFCIGFFEILFQLELSTFYSLSWRNIYAVGWCRKTCTDSLEIRFRPSIAPTDSSNVKINQWNCHALTHSLECVA